MKIISSPIVIIAASLSTTIVTAVDDSSNLITCVEGTASDSAHTTPYFPSCDYLGHGKITICEPPPLGSEGSSTVTLATHCNHPTESNKCACTHGVASCSNAENHICNTSSFKIILHEETGSIHGSMEGCTLVRRGTTKNELEEFKRFFQFDCSSSAAAAL